MQPSDATRVSTREHRPDQEGRRDPAAPPEQVAGLDGYYLIEAGNGVMSSVGFFDTSAQADESTRVASEWVREEKLEAALPNPPKVTDGKVIAHKTNGAVAACGVRKPGLACKSGDSRP